MVNGSIEQFFPRPVVPRRIPGQTIWIFGNADSNCPSWLNGFKWPIDIEGAEALIGMYVNVRFDWTYDEWPDGRQQLKTTKVTITDANSQLLVHERTFPLAADAFIVAAKRMRIER